MTYGFDAIGTSWQIDIYKDISLTQEIQIKEAIRNRIALFDTHYSRFRSDSLVTEMSQKTGVFVLPEDARKMFALYRELYDLTEGLFTPLIGSVLVDAGYDATYSLTQKKTLTAPPTWDEVMEYAHPTLTMKAPALLDFGAAGKGYLIDIVASVLEQCGVSSYCVDAGGDMIHRGKEPLRVGLEDPDDTSKVIGVVDLQNKSLCGSAGNRRSWGNMHHIINPFTQQSTKTISAVWTVADTTLLSDALATCLFFVPPHVLIEKYNFEYLIVHEDRSVTYSQKFPIDALFVS